MVIKKHQIKKHHSVFWKRKLEAQQKRISYLAGVAQESKLCEDARVLKHAKNLHSKELKNAEKEFYTKRYETNLGKWAQLKEETGKGNKGLVKYIINGKETFSPTILANEFTSSSLK